MKPLLLLHLLFCSCSSMRIAGRVEYTEQRITGVARLFAEQGLSVGAGSIFFDPSYRRQK